ncbi:hypothetical protein N9P33_05575 [Gammaproteobacteria bacterium]|nr:hypothetical protein [Gammaproteobacteria bacterium]
MQTSQLFKYSFLFLLSLSVNANDNYISFDQKFMDADWSFLPEVPPSFDENSSKEVELGLSFKNIKTKLYANEIDLTLQRSSEPKDVSLLTIKDGLELGYIFQNDDYLYVLASKQNADQQLFNCYEFSTFILGSCDTANLQISSVNPKYDSLGDNIVSIDAATKSYGIGYKKDFNNFWIESTAIEFVKTSYKYNWLSPLEDIQSPFLLNLTIDGVALGDALNNTLQRFPQREEWNTSQLNLGLKQKFISIYNFNLITEYDLVLLQFSDYREYKNTPEYNFRLRAGIEFYAQNLSLLFYGDAYLNNLIGFEPITFNQRTEHYFDKPYGELGLKFQFKF